MSKYADSCDPSWAIGWLTWMSTVMVVWVFWMEALVMSIISLWAMS